MFKIVILLATLDIVTWEYQIFSCQKYHLPWRSNILDSAIPATKVLVLFLEKEKKKDQVDAN